MRCLLFCIASNVVIKAGPATTLKRLIDHLSSAVFNRVVDPVDSALSAAGRVANGGSNGAPSRSPIGCISRSLFLSSSIAQDATLRNLQTMAESTQRLGDHLKARYPDIDWRALSAFRNVLVHDYLGIDLKLVYQAIQEQMPSLKVAVTLLIDDLSVN
jgi:uncharacterized protein with HEPN domain